MIKCCMEQKILRQVGTQVILFLSAEDYLLPTNYVLILKQDRWCGDIFKIVN